MKTLQFETTQRIIGIEACVIIFACKVLNKA